MHLNSKCDAIFSVDFLGKPLSTFLPVEWGGRVFAYCAEKGFPLKFLFYIFVMFFCVTFCLFVFYFLYSVYKICTLSSPDFIFSNMTENEEETGVTRLALTCVQDWGETGENGTKDGMIEQEYF